MSNGTNGLVIPHFKSKPRKMTWWKLNSDLPKQNGDQNSYFIYEVRYINC